MAFVRRYITRTILQGELVHLLLSLIPFALSLFTSRFSYLISISAVTLSSLLSSLALSLSYDYSLLSNSLLAWLCRWMRCVGGVIV